ncbi:MAG: phospho-N-acetylmuramoyl-pentapeptide-transferase [Tissierellia bacterium]|nr:phospho-N-acetylmuramoyl-pentapeptide-transferase [Tissierellia bacterium]
MHYILIAFIGCIGSILLGIPILPFLVRLKAGQSIRKDGPNSHFVKEGTPTMGGIIFLIVFLIGNIIFGMHSIKQLLILFSTFAFGAIGFIDDYIKVVKKRNLGLRAWQKLVLQIIVALILILFQKYHSGLVDEVRVPFLHRSIDFGWAYFPFILFVVVGTVNSVNLTDGLDGLSSKVTIVVLIFFALATYKLGESDIVPEAVLLAGSLVGFLFYNKYPAKVFMGDTGSLALGGAISGIAVISGLPLFLPFVGGIYFAETLSVIIQVISFKTRGKRVFLMSPLHHHYEEKGWKETKVVKVFFLVSIVLALIGWIML